MPKRSQARKARAKVKTKKTERIELRVTPEQKEKLQGFAKDLGLNLTEYILYRSLGEPTLVRISQAEAVFQAPGKVRAQAQAGAAVEVRGRRREGSAPGDRAGDEANWRVGSERTCVRCGVELPVRSPWGVCARCQRLAFRESWA